jgi:hypothetical protein
MLTLFGIVRFLRQRRASGDRFPCGLALRAHLVLSISTSSPPQALYCDDYDSTASWCASLLLEEDKIVADGGISLLMVEDPGSSLIWTTPKTSSPAQSGAFLARPLARHSRTQR